MKATVILQGCQSSRGLGIAIRAGWGGMMGGGGRMGISSVANSYTGALSTGQPVIPPSGNLEGQRCLLTYPI